MVGDRQREPGVHPVLRDVPAHELRAAEEVHLPARPRHGRVDPVPPQAGPVALDGQREIRVDDPVLCDVVRPVLGPAHEVDRVVLAVHERHVDAAVAPEAGPVLPDRPRVGRGGPLRRDVVADVLPAAQQVRPTVVPHHRALDPVAPQAGPVAGDRLRVAGVHLLGGDVVLHVLVVAEEVRLAVVPQDGRVDPVAPQAAPVRTDGQRVTGVHLAGVDVVPHVLAVAEEVRLAVVPHHTRVDPVAPQARPVRGDGPGKIGVHPPGAGVHAVVLAAREEVHLAVGQEDGRGQHAQAERFDEGAVVVGVLRRRVRVADREVARGGQAVRDVGGADDRGRMAPLVDDGAEPRVGSGHREPEEVRADVDGVRSEVRVRVAVGPAVRRAQVVVDPRVHPYARPGETVQHGLVAGGVVLSEPLRVQGVVRPRGPARQLGDGRVQPGAGVCVRGVDLGELRGNRDVPLLGRRAPRTRTDREQPGPVLRPLGARPGARGGAGRAVREELEARGDRAEGQGLVILPGAGGGGLRPGDGDDVGEPHQQGDLVRAGLVQRVRLRDVELFGDGLSGPDGPVGGRPGVAAAEEAPVVGDNVARVPHLQEVEDLTFERGVPDEQPVLGVAHIREFEGEQDRLAPAVRRVSTDGQTEVFAHRFGSSRGRAPVLPASATPGRPASPAGRVPPDSVRGGQPGSARTPSCLRGCGRRR